VSNLKNAYSRTKEDREKAKTEAAALKAKIAELEKGAPDTAATQAKVTAMQEQLAAAEAKAGDWQAKYVGKARDEALTKALQEAGVTNRTFLEGARAQIERDHKIELSEDGTPTVDDGMGPRLLADFVKVWTASKGKDYVTPPQGGGAKGNDRPTQGGSISAQDLEAMTPQEKAVYFKANPNVKVI
jgi:hypothetical protein